ncbi:hypothetical protein BwiPL1_12040 [Bacillus wiedmannii]|nr:hypothetical protein BwiPL1_12040 [Bacillus wiedmannii]
MIQFMHLLKSAVYSAFLYIDKFKLTQPRNTIQNYSTIFSFTIKSTYEKGATVNVAPFSYVIYSLYITLLNIFSNS